MVNTVGSYIFRTRARSPHIEIIGNLMCQLIETDQGGGIDSVAIQGEPMGPTLDIEIIGNLMFQLIQEGQGEGIDSVAMQG